MAAVLNGACRVMGLREGEPVRRGTLRVWRHVGRDSGASAMSLRVLEAQEGTSPALLNGDCEEALFVLQGRGRVHLDGRPFDLEPDMGVFVPPHTRLVITCGGGEPLVIVSAQCPDPGPQLQIADAGSALGQATSGQGPRVVRLWESEQRPAGDRWYRVLIDGRAGSRQLTQFVGAIPPGRAPDHFHEYEEVLCFLSGQGRLWAGEAWAEVGAEWCAFLPRGQVHCTENTGRGELRLLGVFYPAGSPDVSYAPDAGA